MIWKKWQKGGTYQKALKGSSIAVVDWVSAIDNGPRRLSIFYQDPQFHLREYKYDYSEGWGFSDFDPGSQLRETPISAEVVSGGGVDITVIWRNSFGRAESSSWSQSSGWDPPKCPNEGSEPLDAPASPSDGPPGFIASVDHPLTTVSWENGKEIRIYYLDSQRILQEYAYSEKKKKNCWYYGDLSELKIVLSPDSVIAAIQFDDEIRLYYQDKDSRIIQEAYKPPLTDSWVKGAALSKAVASSKIAVIGWSNNVRLYYQEPNLHLQEHCYDADRVQWTKGAFDPGTQPRGTPIFAEVAYAGYPAIQVLWKNANGHLVGSRCNKYSQWDTPTTENVDSNKRDPSQLDGSG